MYFKVIHKLNKKRHRHIFAFVKWINFFIFFFDKNMKPFWDHKENLDTFHKESLVYVLYAAEKVNQFVNRIVIA